MVYIHAGRTLKNEVSLKKREWIRGWHIILDKVMFSHTQIIQALLLAIVVLCCVPLFFKLKYSLLQRGVLRVKKKRKHSVSQRQMNL